MDELEKFIGRESRAPNQNRRIRSDLPVRRDTVDEARLRKTIKGDKCFYVRAVNATRMLEGPDIVYYVSERWVRAERTSSIDLGASRSNDMSIPPRTQGTLRIVSWNVACGLPKKFEMLEALQPDIAIVPEATNEARLLRAGIDSFNSAAWIGRYAHKGLLALGFGDWSVKMLEKDWDQRLEWILPLRVTGPLDFTLFAVWSQNTKGPHVGVRYPSELHRYPFAHLLEVYGSLLDEGCVIAGDFNHHSQWDKDKPFDDFTPVVDRYAEHGLTSAWHAAHGVLMGDPSEPPTHWMQFNRDKPYSIDYCFVPTVWSEGIAGAWVGGYDEFGSGSPRSDHAPLVVNITV